MRTCSKCKLEKDITQYDKKNNNGELRSECKSCRKLYNKKAYQNRKQRNKELKDNNNNDQRNEN